MIIGHCTWGKTDGDHDKLEIYRVFSAPGIGPMVLEEPVCVMEEVIAHHPDVAECAVVGADDSLKGQVPVGFIVLKAGVTKDHGEIVKETVQMVRGDVGPIACYKQAAIVHRLPKTRSGKVLRGTIRKIADGKDYTAPSTIDDPQALKEIEDAVKTIGYGKKE